MGIRIIDNNNNFCRENTRTNQKTEKNKVEKLPLKFSNQAVGSQRKFLMQQPFRALIMGSLDWFHNIQKGPQTLQGVRETAIVKPIGEKMKLKQLLSYRLMSLSPSAYVRVLHSINSNF